MEAPQLKPFTEEEVQNLRDIFDLFDKEKNGHIEQKDLEAIMNSLQRDSAEAQEFMDQPDAKINFEEFLSIMQRVEQKIAEPEADQLNSQQLPPTAQGIISVAADSKVLDFLRLLEEYRRKCEDEGNYAEAKKAKQKFEELLKKETIR